MGSVAEAIACVGGRSQWAFDERVGLEIESSATSYMRALKVKEKCDPAPLNEPQPWLQGHSSRKPLQRRWLNGKVSRRCEDSPRTRRRVSISLPTTSFRLRPRRIFAMRFSRSCIPTPPYRAILAVEDHDYWTGTPDTQRVWKRILLRSIMQRRDCCAILDSMPMLDCSPVCRKGEMLSCTMSSFTRVFTMG